MTQQVYIGERLGNDYLDTIMFASSIAKGYALEFGVASGRSLSIIAQHLPVTGFDSFEGLPEDWRDGFPKGTFACEAPNIPNAQLVMGWFEDTLGPWVSTHQDKLANLGLVHVDCDLYSSTKVIFDHLEPYLKRGCIIVFDEYHGYPGWPEHEHKAWTEYLARTGRRFSVLGHGPEQLAVMML